MPIVLVVDDSPVDRRVIEGLFERQADLDWLVEFAENGAEALDKMRDFLPDIVVTDLQMPEMNGLELVNAVGSTYPHVPVVVITGKGSEYVALEALDSGASSYVPKNLLAERLISTIEQVAGAARARRGQRRVASCITEVQLKLQLDNDMTIIRPVVDYLKETLETVKFGDENERLHVSIALEEAIVNAMLHGNLELPPDEVREARSDLEGNPIVRVIQERCADPPYCDRKVCVEAQLGRRQVRLVVRDQGSGFALEEIPQKGDPKTLEGSACRGLVLMRNFMDEVTYNDARNEVTLLKNGW